MRACEIDHRILAVLGGGPAGVACVLTFRAAMLVWHNEIPTRLSGTYLRQNEQVLPMLKVDVLSEIARRPPNSIFIGREPLRRFGLFWSSQPVHMTHRQKPMHRHVLGKPATCNTRH